MKKFLILDLEAPTVSFGSNTVDAIGRVDDFPTQSMITGLIANALGYDRAHTKDHDALQANIRFGAIIIREGARSVDYQTAAIFKSDKAWTTNGSVVAREMGAEGTTIRMREFEADKRVVVALEVVDAADNTLDAIAHAVMYPERPIFIGRKPNLPSGYISAPGVIEAETLSDALAKSAGIMGVTRPSRAILPMDEPSAPGDQIRHIYDSRNWSAGAHTGARGVRSRRIQPISHIGAAA